MAVAVASLAVAAVPASAQSTDGDAAGDALLDVQPLSAVLRPGQSVTFSASASDPVRGVLEIVECRWSAPPDAGTFTPADAPDPCARTFTAGDAAGATYVVTVTATLADGAVLVASAPVIVVAPSASVRVDAGLDDATAVCQATVPPGGAASVEVTGGCPVEHVDVRVVEPVDETLTISVRTLDALPPGTPAPGSIVPLLHVFDVHLTAPSGATVRTSSLHVAFHVPPEWLEDTCPADACVPALFHLTDEGWEVIRTYERDEASGTLAARSASFSLFAVGGVAPGGAGAVPLTGPGTALFMVGGAVLLLVALGAVRVRARYRDNGAGRASGSPRAEASSGTPETGSEVAEELIAELRDEELLEFIATASHDLAGPLTPIMIQLNLLAEDTNSGALSDEQREAVEVVQRNVEQLDMLVNDLKDAARLQAGHLEMYPEPADLHEIVANAVRSFQAPAEAAGVALELVGPHAPLPVQADPGRITQVLYNFLSNAVKFTGDGGRVSVRARVVDEEVVVRVRDTGVGLARNEIDRLFQPFSQVHDARLRRKGSGLGLYICKGIIEAHGGRIWCESAGRGTGSAFVFSVPLAEGASGAAADRAAGARQRGDGSPVGGAVA